MKKYTIIICLIALTIQCQAQALSFTQLQSLFNTWMSNKGTSINSVTNKLKQISPKWKLKSSTPTIDGELKYYVWQCKESRTDTALVAVLIEEDETTTRYSLKYAMHSNQLFKSLESSLRGSPYYKNGRVVTFTDKSKGETTITGTPSETGALSTRIDCFLIDYNSSEGNNPRLLTMELRSRYIQK